MTNGGSRLELKSPPDRCQGEARAAHQKHPGGVFLRPQLAAGNTANKEKRRLRGNFQPLLLVFISIAIVWLCPENLFSI